MKKEFNILFLSNMMEEKGVWTLLDSCKILRDKNIDCRCHLIGKWSDIDEASFLSQINQMGLDGYVLAHGAKYGEEKQLFFDNADIFVFPTYYHNECFPLVLLEAMQNKLPCIATREGGIPEIIEDGITGYLVGQKQYNQIANHIEFLINHPIECKKMGIAGYNRFLSNFTLSCFENKLKDILTELL